MSYFYFSFFGLLFNIDLTLFNKDIITNQISALCVDRGQSFQCLSKIWLCVILCKRICLCFQL